MPDVNLENVTASAVTPVVTKDLDSDSNGNWDLQILNTLTPGMHKMVVTDEFGEEQEMSFYVVKESASTALVNRVTTVMPVGYAYAAIIWIVLILALILAYLRLARHTDRREGSKNHKHYARYGLVICAVSLVITLSTGIFVNYKTKIFNHYFSQIYGGNHARVSVRGAVLDPLTGIGVEGISLVNENSSIRTAAGGNFEFSDVDSSLGIRIANGELNREILWYLSDEKIQNTNIYFNIGMLNRLIYYIDLEAQNKKNELYDFLPASVKTKVSIEEFANNYRTIFTRDDITNQNLRIKSAEVIEDFWSEDYQLNFERVVKCVIINNRQKSEYFMVPDESNWFVIK